MSTMSPKDEAIDYLTGVPPHRRPQYRELTPEDRTDLAAMRRAEVVRYWSGLRYRAQIVDQAEIRDMTQAEVNERVAKKREPNFWVHGTLQVRLLEDEMGDYWVWLGACTGTSEIFPRVNLELIKATRYPTFDQAKLEFEHLCAEESLA